MLKRVAWDDARFDVAVTCGFLAGVLTWRVLDYGTGSHPTAETRWRSLEIDKWVDRVRSLKLG